MRKGRWTEIYTRKKDHIPGDLEYSEGRNHGQGWACTCGCNKRIPHRKHSDGPPREACSDGYTPTTGGVSEAYRNNFDLIQWNR